MAVGETVMVRARHRPDSLWVEGYSTLDVPSAYWEAYPHEPFRRFRRERGSVGELTATQLWELYRLLPTPAEYEIRDSIALRRLDQWSVENPQLTERYPAHEVVRMVRVMFARPR
jgi:hypothetical protein